MKNVFVSFAILLLSSCTVPPKTDWYVGDVPEKMNGNVLKDKVIVLDPGHGGVYKGAVGKNGLTEKEINLRVARKLFSMLEALGAQPILTRSIEKDFLMDTTKVRNLKADLSERMKRANLVNADLFISMHHNASYDRGYNATKTFYVMGDAGPSFSAAGYIHRQFVKNLKIDKDVFLPGNYFVLRNSKSPGVLGEPSYLSNPIQENILTEELAVEVEARAYLQGIYDYFNSDISVINKVYLSGEVFNYSYPLILANVTPGLSGLFETGIDCEIDSKKANISYNGKKLIAIRPDGYLKNGWHTLKLSLHGQNGSMSSVFKTKFKINLSPAKITVKAKTCVMPDSKGYIIKIESEVFDSVNTHVADSNVVVFSSSCGRWEMDSVRTRKGKAINYLRVLKKENPKIKVICGNIEKELDSVFQKNTEYVCGFVIDSLQNKRIYKARILSQNGIPITMSDVNGFYYIHKRYGSPMIKKRGYYFLKTKNNNLNKKLYPINSGTLFGKRILIDPEYGGEEPGPKNKNGMRAADLNMRFAKKLAYYLEQAGANVSYTRYSNKYLTPYQRVDKSIVSKSNLVISIGYDSTGTDKVSLNYYPSSNNGKKLCSIISDFITKMVGAKKIDRYFGLANIVLQQTPCTALRVSLGNIQKNIMLPVTEECLAYSIYCGIVSNYNNKTKAIVTKLVLPDSLLVQTSNSVVVDNYHMIPIVEKKYFTYCSFDKIPHTIKFVSGNKTRGKIYILKSEKGNWKLSEI